MILFTRRYAQAAAICLALMMMAGCDGRPRHSVSNADSGSAKEYAMKGIIVSADPSRGEVTIDTQPIPGFMEAMTMPYKLKNPNVIQDLHPGDHMNGQLLVSNGSALLDQIVITAHAQPDYKPAVQYHVPEPGDAVPDFKLTNQNGKRISIDSFRGKALLITFIYTRCPLSDYCPKMSRNFAEIDKQLAADPELYRKTHLLSISFDPVYDTPAVLKSYGEAYTGRFTKETFGHWDFAAPPKDELQKMLSFFDVGATPGENKTITHSLSTVVIGPDGKIAAWYPTNDWSPSAVLGDLKKAASGGQAQS
jgi:protein SCO1/2